MGGSRCAVILRANENSIRLKFYNQNIFLIGRGLQLEGRLDYNFRQCQKCICYILMSFYKSKRGGLHVSSSEVDQCVIGEVTSSISSSQHLEKKELMLHICYERLFRLTIT
jgi:hypothetical protein